MDLTTDGAFGVILIGWTRDKLSLIDSRNGEHSVTSICIKVEWISMGIYRCDRPRGGVVRRA